MRNALNEPARCADCGSDAYIRMDVGRAPPEVLCAHCYADRLRVGKKVSSSPAVPERAARRTQAREAR